MLLNPKSLVSLMHCSPEEEDIVAFQCLGSFQQNSLLNADLHERAETCKPARSAERDEVFLSWRTSDFCNIQTLTDERNSVQPFRQRVITIESSPSRPPLQPSQPFPTPNQERAWHLISLWVPDWYLPTTPYILFLRLLHDPLLHFQRLTESSGPRLC